MLFRSYLWTPARTDLLADPQTEITDTEIPLVIQTQAEMAETLTKVRKELGIRKKRLTKHIKEIDKTRLQQNIERKRNNLGTQKRSIQRAMGKEPMKADLIALQSKHPDSITIQLTLGLEPTSKQIREIWHEQGQLQCTETTREGLECTFTFEDDTHIHRALEVAKAQGWNVTRLSRQNKMAHTPSNILAGIEAELGDIGRSVRTQCKTCHNKNLLTITRKTETDRELGTYCKDCRQITDTEITAIQDTEIPWSQEIIDSFAKVPDNPEFRLRGTITMKELKYIIQHLALGKAPGPIGQLPAEVWRQAPEPILDKIGRAHV